MQFSLRTAFLVFVVVWSSLALGEAILSDPYAPLPLLFAVALFGGFVLVSKSFSLAKEATCDAPRWFLSFLLVSVFCYLMAAGLDLVESRQTMWLVMCRSNLQRIGVALHNYATKHHTFPPAYIADKQGKPMHSWRTLILPYLRDANAASLYKQYRFDESWDGPNNRKLIADAPWDYQCLYDVRRSAHVPHTTSYVAVVGPKTAWPGDKPMKPDDIGSRTSNTILLVEVANSDIAWSEPRDLSWEDCSRRLHASSGTAISNKHQLPCGFLVEDSPGTIHALLADDDVRGLRDSQLSPEWAKTNFAVGGYSERDFRGDVWYGSGVNWRNCCALLVWTGSVYLLLRRASRYRARASQTPPPAPSGSC
jgi:hypothetical protein